jgi:hypothetical protein
MAHLLLRIESYLIFLCFSKKNAENNSDNSGVGLLLFVSASSQKCETSGASFLFVEDSPTQLSACFQRH